MGDKAWGGAEFQGPQGTPDALNSMPPMPPQQPPTQPSMLDPGLQQPAPPTDQLPPDPMRYLLESVIQIRNAAGNAHQEQVVTRQALEALVQHLETLSTGASNSSNTPSGTSRGNVRASEVDAFLEEVDAAILLQPVLRDADETRWRPALLAEGHEEPG
ncbi:hypothetical protein C8Q78DRAFT_988306 [Trametes maxima]|nr:hypothetical protein C8Q78DRAFT_988302 [Trametes maxima]KAI0675803.1 hypothetical protein C8Q78DRAFT_988306 [Trametes maxima]